MRPFAAGIDRHDVFKIKDICIADWLQLREFLSALSELLNRIKVISSQIRARYGCHCKIGLKSGISWDFRDQGFSQICVSCNRPARNSERSFCVCVLQRLPTHPTNNQKPDGPAHECAESF